MQRLLLLFALLGASEALIRRGKTHERKHRDKPKGLLGVLAGLAVADAAVLVPMAMTEAIQKNEQKAAKQQKPSVNAQIQLARKRSENTAFHLSQKDYDAALAQQQWAEKNLKNATDYLKQAENVYIELEKDKLTAKNPEQYVELLEKAKKSAEIERKRLHEVAIENNRSYEMAIKQLWSPLNKSCLLHSIKI